MRKRTKGIKKKIMEENTERTPKVDKALDKKIDRLMEEVAPHNKAFIDWLKKRK